MDGNPTLAAPLRALGAHVRSMAAIAVLAAAIVIAPAAAARDDKDVKSKIVIMEPLTLSKTRDMDFGFVAPPVAGTVLMTYDVDNGSACAASAGLIRGGNCEAAEFAGYGEGGQRVTIRMPAGREIVLAGPGTDMLVSDLDIYLGEGLERRNGGNGRNQQFNITGDEGEFFFRIGGTLNVAANQASGIYDGEFTMVIDYR